MARAPRVDGRHAASFTVILKLRVAFQSRCRLPFVAPATPAARIVPPQVHWGALRRTPDARMNLFSLRVVNVWHVSPGLKVVNL